MLKVKKNLRFSAIITGASRGGSPELGETCCRLLVQELAASSVCNRSGLCSKANSSAVKSVR